MSKLNDFFFNGQKYSTAELVTLSDLINYFGYKSVLFVLEYNHYICSETEWPKIEIKNNDKIEVITIVGGG
jgi:sulfur carrier protein